jgi:tRNA (guanine37-N1)-methyltransferase
MRIEILTLFPEIFDGFLKSSLVGKAIARGLLQASLVNIRDFADPPHFSVDDTPYGGGPGMVMKAEPLLRAIRSSRERLPGAKVILLSASGRPFKQTLASEFSGEGELILVCGRYEGVDERVIELEIDEEISIGDFVLMGGEVPAMVLIEATLRLKDLVLGNAESAVTESFAGTDTLLEAPQYTRPPEIEGLRVPDILLSGNHKKIADWRHETALKRTRERRPDLLCQKKTEEK